MNIVETQRCWRCGQNHPVALFCLQCNALQLLPPQVDYFQVLGLPHSPVVDENLLQQRYYELSRRLHPDLYQTGTTEEQEASLKNTALLNRAYRTLRDLVQRGQYWLELQGEELGRDNKRVPPALAELVFTVQEKLAEMREKPQQKKEQETAAELASICTDLHAQMEPLRKALVDNLAQWGTHPCDARLLTQLKTLLSEIAYLRTLIRDVEKESDPLWNA